MRARLFVLTAIACIGLLAGCGGDGDSGSESSEPGAKVFADAGCGGCHTLDAAGSSGSVGPNLDDANPSFDEVVAKVKSGGGAMPSFEGDLSDQEIRDVADIRLRREARPGGGSRLQDQAVQAEHRAARGMSRRRLPSAGIRKHRLPRRPETGTRTLRGKAQRRCRRGRLSPDRAHDRRRLAPALRRERRQGARRGERDLRVRLLPRPPGVEARRRPEGQRSPRSRARSATRRRAPRARSSTTSASTGSDTG